jgi:hypothetical protein
MSVITRTLSKPSRERFAELEEIIERNIKSFIEAGNAIWEIRESGYYLITHKSFEGYCGERWGFGRSYAYRLIQSAKVTERITTGPQVAEKVLPVGDTPLPTTERQVRELAKAPEDEQAEVWQEVIETTAKPTAAAVKAVIEKRKTKKNSTVSDVESLPNGGKVYRHDAPMPEWYMDDNRVAVPKELYPVWRRKWEYARLSQELPSFELSAAIKELGQSLDHEPTVAFADALYARLMAMCADIRQSVSNLKPSVVIDGKWYSRLEMNEMAEVNNG